MKKIFTILSIITLFISCSKEIEEVNQKHQEGFAKLKEMFLIDDETANNISVSINFLTDSRSNSCSSLKGFQLIFYGLNVF